MKIIRILKALPLLVVAAAVIYVSVYICIDNGGWAYIAARLAGLEKKYAGNVELIVIAAQSIFFTSDWFYRRIGMFLDRRIEKSKGLNHQIYLGYKTGIACLIALPKRTILFGIYLLLIVLESIGVIDQAKDYAVVVVFIIAIDRVAKIWPEERERLKEFLSKAGGYIKKI
ncbi:hypothetical protein [Suipraeoptans intestinalis]|uniref:hypothetical protein n=1 Tax=Suipraeoptans intestinalis TaxID=2606628 RepID=UPI0012B40C96|nr:hypothetical protein [Suipraeoptans intestinalis]